MSESNEMSFQFLSLPYELQLNVMKRLPVETLVVCACVSKSLYNFISNPVFFDAHYKYSKHKTCSILLAYSLQPSTRTTRVPKRYTTHFGLYPDNESCFEESSNVKLIRMPRFDGFNEPIYIIGCYNGVICIVEAFESFEFIYTRIILWNPSIRKMIQVPHHTYDGLRHDIVMPYLFGFGCDQVTNDIKVVRLFYLRRLDNSADYPGDILVEVYSVSSGSWRSIIQGFNPMHMICDYCTGYITQGPYGQCFVNGALHWRGLDSNSHSEDLSVIVTFDLHDECFGEINLPACVQGSKIKPFDVMLAPWLDTLSLIKRPSKDFRPYISPLCIWVMKEYGKSESWMQLYKFDYPKHSPIPRALYYRKNKEVLILEGLSYETKAPGPHTILSCDYDSNYRKNLRNIEGNISDPYMCAYEEGLALFKKGTSYTVEEVEDKSVLKE